VLIFAEGGNSESPEKNIQSKRELTNKQLYSHMQNAGIEPRSQW
jgi:hypothetical protein